MKEYEDEIPKLESSSELKNSEIAKLPQIESEKLSIVDQLSMEKQELAVKNSIVKDTDGTHYGNGKEDRIFREEI